MLKDNGHHMVKNYASNNANYYTFSLPAGTYSSKIYATRTGQLLMEILNILIQKFRMKVFFGTLAAPVVSMVENVLTWDECSICTIL